MALAAILIVPWRDVDGDYGDDDGDVVVGDDDVDDDGCCYNRKEYRQHARWYHDMETLHALLTLCEGNPLIVAEFSKCNINACCLCFGGFCAIQCRFW